MLTESEIKIIKALPSEERMSYFMKRILENDAVWSLADDKGWKVSADLGKLKIQLWPYKEYVDKSDEKDNIAMMTVSFLLNGYLSHLIKSKIDIEIFPVSNDPGIILSALEFKTILEKEMEFNSLE